MHCAKYARIQRWFCLDISNYDPYLMKFMLGTVQSQHWQKNLQDMIQILERIKKKKKISPDSWGFGAVIPHGKKEKQQQSTCKYNARSVFYQTRCNV